MPVAVSLYLLRLMAKSVERHLALVAPGDSVGPGPPQADGPYLERSNCLLCWQCPICFSPKLECLRLSVVIALKWQRLQWEPHISPTFLRELPHGFVFPGDSLDQSISKPSGLVSSRCDGWECSPRSHVQIGRVLRPGGARGHFLKMPVGYRQDGVPPML